MIKDSEVSQTLAIVNVPDRTLDDVEFTTAVESVGSRTSGTKALINPNVLVMVDERDDSDYR